MKYKLLFYFFICFFTTKQLLGQPSSSSRFIIPLEGIWQFRLDPFETGVNSNGVQLLPQLTETVVLPGSTDENGKGYKTTGGTSLRLTRTFEYRGAAWYEKEIYVPTTWKGKVVQLLFERVHWESGLWINDKPVGKRESLSAPHVYDISSLIKAGEKNRIRVRVDNDKIYNLEYAHAISAETQTNWNGIIGKMQLQAFDPVYISSVQVYPEAATKSAKLKIRINNATGTRVQGKLSVNGTSFNSVLLTAIPEQQVIFSGTGTSIEVEANITLGKTIQTWDEFNPALYQLNISLTANNNKDNKQAIFGIRDLATKGTQFVFNGRPTFIRATVNSAEFPLTAYPSMDLASWLHILKTCKTYGLNAMRFHSWCPPEAAFEAADQLGIYLQIENNDWRFTIGADTAVNRFLKQEGERILATYGNHPSFVFFCEGNELVGPKVKEFLSEQVSHWKAIDPRHLYTGSAAYPVIPENAYNVYYGARPHRWKEGLQSRFNVNPIDTRYDYSEYVAKQTIPMITHEVGQWCVYPDFSTLDKYKGVLKPYNYDLFRELLREHKMLNQAQLFMMASGKYQVIMKKEEVESYLRTPGFGGYHMLQLNDFPGQGTAPVGVVDVFWDAKPYVTAEEFSQFQSARVPLLQTSSFTWTNDEIFKATASFANFGEAEMRNATAHWAISYPDGKIYAKGDFKDLTLSIGSPLNLGEINVPLKTIQHATKLIVTIKIDKTNIANSWNIWVYPAQLPAIEIPGVLVTHLWNEETKAYLQKGGKVLLLADTANIISNAEPVVSGISWNTVWSGMPPNLLGILCDPSHPALKNFPTEYHSNWQWWDIIHDSKPMVLDNMPDGFTPLIQMIPDWNNPRKIGLAFECKAGKGSLLVSAANLTDSLEKRPVARQLLYSLKQYIRSSDFAPSDEVPVQTLDSLFKK